MSYGCQGVCEKPGQWQSCVIVLSGPVNCFTIYCGQAAMQQ